MSDVNANVMDVFPKWLKSLGDDVKTIINAAANEKLDKDVRRYLVGGINYLFKSLDLIPDGIDDIGYLDDAFVLRITVKKAMDKDNGSIDPELRPRLNEMAEDTGIITSFLTPNLYNRLEVYVDNLKNGAARGRMVDDIVESVEVFEKLAEDAHAFASEFSAPAFSRDEKTLIKLTSFLEAKLPK